MSHNPVNRRFLPPLAPLLILLAIALFYLATLRQGHIWGDDFAQYLQHADNLAQGRPYAQSGYVYNPLNTIVGPQAYPPGLPVVMAPAVGLAGRNLIAVKLEMVLLFLATVLVTTVLFAPDLARGQNLVFMALVGFSPAFWQYKETILSEHLFLPLWYLAILIADRWYRPRRAPGRPALHGLLLGLVIYLAYATRSAGIVLLPAVLLAEILLARRLTVFGLAALGTGSALVVLQKVFLPVAGQGYAEQLGSIGLATLKHNVIADAVSIGNLWENGYSMFLATLVTVAMSAVCCLQFVRSNWPKPTFLGIATALYLVMITLWPSATGLRLTLPLLPAILFYVLLATAGPKWNPGTRRRVLAAFCVFMAVSYVAWYSAADYGPIEGVEDPAAAELFAFVRSHTAEADVCLFFKPRALAFYTHRRASAYPLAPETADLFAYADSIRATLLIARKDADGPPETLVAQRADPRLVEVWQNGLFRVFRLIRP